jgi:hypothetical protein
MTGFKGLLCTYVPDICVGFLTYVCTCTQRKLLLRLYVFIIMENLDWEIIINIFENHLLKCSSIFCHPVEPRQGAVHLRGHSQRLLPRRHYRRVQFLQVVPFSTHLFYAFIIYICKVRTLQRLFTCNCAANKEGGVQVLLCHSCK